MNQTNSSWGGRFAEATDAFVAEFTASIGFDQRLYRHDIQGSIAHATMLAECAVLTVAEKDAIDFFVWEISRDHRRRKGGAGKRLACQMQHTSRVQVGGAWGGVCVHACAHARGCFVCACACAFACVRVHARAYVCLLR